VTLARFGNGCITEGGALSARTKPRKSEHGRYYRQQDEQR
jgi:hypothetical protein